MGERQALTLAEMGWCLYDFADGHAEARPDGTADEVAEPIEATAPLSLYNQGLVVCVQRGEPSIFALAHGVQQAQMF